MNKSKYIKLGALILCCIAIIVWGVNYLKGIDIFKSSTTYYAKYYKVEGLVKSSSIFINGFQVGLVQGVEFSDANDGSFVVELEVQGDFKIPHGSKAILASSDLLGTKAIKLMLQPNSAYYQEGDTLPSSIDNDMLELLGNEVMPIKDKAERLITSLDSTMYALNATLNSETQENLRQSIKHFNTTMQNMEGISGQLNSVLQAQRGGLHDIISNIDTLTTALALSSGDINHITNKLSSLADSLSESNIKANLDGIATILAKIENGEGTIGSLVNDNALYENLDEMTASLNQILLDFQHNPSKYLKLTGIDFGKDIYLSSADISNDEKYTFRILFMESSEAIELNSPIFSDLKVEEVAQQNGFAYVSPKLNDFERLNKQFQQAKKRFPRAEIIAFKNGKSIRLSKALKALSK